MANNRKISFTIDKDFYDYTKEDLEKMASKYNMDYDKFLSQLFQIGIEATKALSQPCCSLVVKELCESWVKDRT